MKDQGRQAPRHGATERGRRGVFSLVLAGLLVAGVLMPGCSILASSSTGSGSIRAVSRRDAPVQLEGSFHTVVYSHDSERGTSFLLTDIEPDRFLAGDADDGQVVHIELLWRPKPGATPMDDTATNISIRHVIFSGGEMGIYGGSGFALADGALGSDHIRIDVRNSTLTLLEATGGFVDLLSPATMLGSFSARHDPAATRRLHFGVSQHVTNLLGETRFVEGAAEDAGQPAETPVILTRK